MKILVINGPNLNLLGLREREIYGNESYEDLLDYIRRTAAELGVEVELFQSNHEDVLQREDFRHISYAGMACIKTFSGMGFAGYAAALRFLAERRPS